MRSGLRIRYASVPSRTLKEYENLQRDLYSHSSGSLVSSLNQLHMERDRSMRRQDSVLMDMAISGILVKSLNSSEFMLVSGDQTGRFGPIQFAYLLCSSVAWGEREIREQGSQLVKARAAMFSSQLHNSC